LTEKPAELPIRWVDHGVQLADGTVVLASTAAVAADLVAAARTYPRRAVTRAVASTPRPQSGDATVDIGTWAVDGAP
jgi:hypothetical protein